MELASHQSVWGGREGKQIGDYSRFNVEPYWGPQVVQQHRFFFWKVGNSRSFFFWLAECSEVNPSFLWLLLRQRKTLNNRTDKKIPLNSVSKSTESYGIRRILTGEKLHRRGKGSTTLNHLKLYASLSSPLLPNKVPLWVSGRESLCLFVPHSSPSVP